jgi:RNA polymerase sigma factor (sigma-70 family)
METMMLTASSTVPVRAEAARLLYERYHANVYRYALSQLRSPQDADDAVQNTFLRAFAALQKGTVPEDEAAWLFKIAHNVCATSKLAWLRRRRVEAPRDLTTLALEPSSPETRRDELAGLEDALAAMPPRPREAFLLREWQGLSYTEIAERLDTSQSAVETLIFRARKLLAKQLEQPVQGVRRALGLGPLLGLLRGWLGGAPAAVKAAAAIAVSAGATVAATPLVTSDRAAQSASPARTLPANVVPAASAAEPQPGPPRAARQRTNVRRPPHSSAVLHARVPLAPGTPATAPTISARTAAPPTAATNAAPTTTTSPTPAAPSTRELAAPSGAVAPLLQALEALPPAPAAALPSLPVIAPSLPELLPSTSPAVPPVTVPDPGVVVAAVTSAASLPVPVPAALESP